MLMIVTVIDPLFSGSGVHVMTAVSIVDRVIGFRTATYVATAIGGKTRGYQVQMAEAGFLRGPEEGDFVIGDFEKLQHVVDVHPVVRGFRVDDLHGARRTIQRQFPVIIGRTRFRGVC